MRGMRVRPGLCGYCVLRNLSVKRLSSIRNEYLVMLTAMAPRELNRLNRRQGGRVAQIRREHQNQRRNDAESEKRI